MSYALQCRSRRLGLRAGVPDNLALPSSNVFLFLQNHHCISSPVILRALANMVRLVQPAIEI
jgi:hypothetical protein